ncbi:MAG: cellulase family glycosylhydrolase [Pirellula sp.]
MTLQLYLFNYLRVICFLTSCLCNLSLIRAEETTVEDLRGASPATAIAFQHTLGQWVTAQGSELVVWDELCRNVQRRMETEIAKIHDVKFSGNGSQILVAGGVPGEEGILEQYTWPEFQLLARRVIPNDTLLRIDWHSSQGLIAVAVATGKLLLLDDHGLESRWEVDAHPNSCTAVQLFPELGLLASGGNDAAIRLWKLEDGSAVRSLSQHTAGITQLLSTPTEFDSKVHMVSISRDQTVRLWDPQTGRLVRFVRLAAAPNEAAWEKPILDGEVPMLWVLGGDGRLRRIDLKQATIEQDIQGDREATYALGSYADRLFVTGVQPEPITIAMREPLQRIGVSEDGNQFIIDREQQEFRVRGFNYDHDQVGRLIEDYWNEQWSEVESDFCEMQELGANTVRIHLQFGRFMKSATEPDTQSLAKFSALVQLAERTRLYLDVTGLGCYHKKDAPAWYDALNEEERWAAQAVFWRAVVQAAKKSPAVFCWDLMNEPVVPGGKRGDRDWLGPAFGDKYFVQFITLDQANRARPEIAKAWTKHLAEAIRETGDPGLITVGLVDWSLNRPGLTSGFEPEQIVEHVDFIAMHLYPQSDQLEKNAETLRGFRLGKPLIIEECFPLKCSTVELRNFLREQSHVHNGWISFYWGSTPDELLEQKTIPAAITREWLLGLP